MPILYGTPTPPHPTEPCATPGRWFDKAAQQGNADAQFNLATCLLRQHEAKKSKTVLPLCEPAPDWPAPVLLRLVPCSIRGARAA